MMKRYWHKLWRCAIADIMYSASGADMRKKVDMDAARYLEKETDSEKKLSGKRAVNYLLVSGNRTFRSVFYYRMGRFKRVCSISRILLPACKAIEIYGKVDGGLFLNHNHMVVHTLNAGKNLSVGAGVVIGRNNNAFPAIGDNVTIGANSTVIGDITIGDNAVILPGSVVTRSIEENGVYGGNPAKRIADGEEK